VGGVSYIVTINLPNRTYRWDFDSYGSAFRILDLMARMSGEGRCTLQTVGMPKQDHHPTLQVFPQTNTTKEQQP
jgi:hypothetical protein